MTLRSKTSNVGAALDKLLLERGSNLSDLSSTTNTSPSYLSHLASGRRKANAQWLELVADSLHLTENEREELYKAGARDHGFKL